MDDNDDGPPPPCGTPPKKRSRPRCMAAKPSCAPRPAVTLDPLGGWWSPCLRDILIRILGAVWTIAPSTIREPIGSRMVLGTIVHTDPGNSNWGVPHYKLSPHLDGSHRSCLPIQNPKIRRISWLATPSPSRRQCTVRHWIWLATPSLCRRQCLRHWISWLATSRPCRCQWPR